MGLKRNLILLLLITLTFTLSACDSVFKIYVKPTTTSATTEAISLVDGTIDLSYSDYLGYPNYNSPLNDIDNVEEYNTVLLSTQEHIKRSTIKVTTTLSETRKYPWQNDYQEYEIGIISGSGFVFMNQDGYYYSITNYHVVDPEDYNATYQVMVYESDTFYQASLVAYDDNMDLAVLRFSDTNLNDVEIIDIASRLMYKYSDSELLLAVGNPKSLLYNVTIGEFLGMEDIANVNYKVIYHNASIEEGSSGGALVDAYGSLIGVNTWGSETARSESYAIPNYIVYEFLVNNGILVP